MSCNLFLLISLKYLQIFSYNLWFSQTEHIVFSMAYSINSILQKSIAVYAAHTNELVVEEGDTVAGM